MLAALMIVLCVVARVLPHPSNFTPVGAVAVFAGRTLPRRYAIGLTLVTMLASDLLLTRLHGMSYVNAVTPFVYAGFAAQVLLGAWLRRKRGGAVASAALGAVAFFVLSNFGVWVAGSYGYSAAGFAACYAAAIPFFGATIAGDVLWALGLSLGYQPVARWLSARSARFGQMPLSDSALV